jgi:8-oxo-dGTP pyrophosphatase MutT (NUDIX family)
VIRQVAALPYRPAAKGGGIEVLLLTSRRTRRWIVPKGNIDRGRSLPDMAAVEAYEEAGVEGHVAPRPFGHFEYRKFRDAERSERAVVSLYPLRVELVYEGWPEMAQRTRRWFDADKAAAKVDDPGLGQLIAQFARRLRIP